MNPTTLQEFELHLRALAGCVREMVVDTTRAAVVADVVDGVAIDALIREITEDPDGRIDPARRVELLRDSFRELLACRERGFARPPDPQALQAAKLAGVEDEARRWQEAIDKVVVEVNPDRDGAGCESGDPLDVTLAELRQTFALLQERAEQRLKENWPAVVALAESNAAADPDPEPPPPSPPPASPARRCERMRLDWSTEGGVSRASWAGLSAWVEHKAGPITSRYAARVRVTETHECVLDSTAMGVEPKTEAAARKLCEVFMWHAATYGQEPEPAPTPAKPRPAPPAEIDEAAEEDDVHVDDGYLAAIDAACPKVGDSVVLADLFDRWMRPHAKRAAEASGRYRIELAPSRGPGRRPLKAVRIAPKKEPRK